MFSFVTKTQKWLRQDINARMKMFVWTFSLTFQCHRTVIFEVIQYLYILENEIKKNHGKTLTKLAR